LSTKVVPQLYDLALLEPLLSDGQIVLTPNFRLARRIKAEWDQLQIERGLDCWQPVRVYPLETYLQQCWQHAAELGDVPRRALSTSLQLKELWVQVIEADRHEQGDYRLLQTGSAADLAQQARDNLLRAMVDPATPAVSSEFLLDPDCGSFYRWLRRFESELGQHATASRSDLFVDLAKCTRPVTDDSVVLLDFDDIPPLHLHCLERHCSAVTHRSGARGEARITAVSYPDREAELAAVARWAAREHQLQPDRTLGILLADMDSDRTPLEYALRREFDCLGENYSALPVNFSTGITLDRAPVIRDALRLLAIATEQLPMADLLGIVHSRFVSPSDSGAPAIVKLLQQLYRDGSAEVDTGRLRHLARLEDQSGLALGRVLTEVTQLRLKFCNELPSAWVGRLCQVLDLWHWPGDGPLDSLEYQQVQSWQEVLETFAGFDGISGQLNLDGALALLQRCCQAQISQPQTADARIQVLGPLEGAGLHFDSIWLCGLQGSRWPAPARPNPFIPLALQRRFQMPHATSEREWQYAAGLMRQYGGACQELRISHARQLDGVPELPSPLLQGVPVEALEVDAELPAHWRDRQLRAKLDAIDDFAAPGLDGARLHQVSGGSGILQDQASCPFRAFARNRLLLQPLDDYGAGLSAAERGSLLHNALFVLWGELQDSHTLRSMQIADQQAAIARASSTAIDEVPAGLRQVVGMACLELEQQRLCHVLQEWLAVEIAREPFTVSERETPLETKVGELPLRLRVDRVDTLADGSRVVIDYKSGRSSLSSWLGQRMAQPQLPLYGMATEVQGIAFAQLRSRDCKFVGLGEVQGISGVTDDIAKALGRTESQAQSWSELSAEWQHNLESLAAAFVRGEAQVDPMPGACNYCGLQALCRVGVAQEQAS
jgi:ATP-dependent helicase/nuclease subunit B